MGAAIATGLNDINDIPRAWRHALTALQVLFPDAMMAGGCLRDREHGVGVKDIDIFVPGASIHDAEKVAKILHEEGWRDVGMNNGDMYMGELIACVETKYPDAPPIQINVGQWNMENLAERMDFGICQISFDGKRIRRTAAYLRDRAAKHFRVEVACDDTRFVRSVNRWARLKEKYPTWQFHMGTRATSLSGGTAHTTGARTGRYADLNRNVIFDNRIHPVMGQTYRRKVVGPNMQQITKNNNSLVIDVTAEALLRTGIQLSDAGKRQLQQILSEGPLKAKELNSDGNTSAS